MQSRWWRIPFLFLALAVAPASYAAQLSSEASAAIPYEVQQLLVIDYGAISGSEAAVELRDRLIPPEFHELEGILRKSGIDIDHTAEQLDFALFRTKPNADQLLRVGIVQGQFSAKDIRAAFVRQELKSASLRSYTMYSLSGNNATSMAFLDSSTIVFGHREAVRAALDTYDGVAPSLAGNQEMIEKMKLVDSEPFWSVLDAIGTRTMMHQVLGQAQHLADVDEIRKRLQLSQYSMSFQNDVHFDLAVSTDDPASAATIAALLNIAAVYRKTHGTDAEKQALEAATITADASQLSIHFAATESAFKDILQTPLFKSLCGE